MAELSGYAVLLIVLMAVITSVCLTMIACRAALPAALGVASRPAPPGKSERILVLADRLPTLLARDAAFKRAPQQRQLYELLEQLEIRLRIFEVDVSK